MPPPLPSLETGGLRQLCTCATNTYIRFVSNIPLSSLLDAPLLQATPPTSCSAIARYVSLRTFTCTSCTSTSIYVRRLIAGASVMMLRLCRSNFLFSSFFSIFSNSFSFFFSATSFQKNFEFVFLLVIVDIIL